MQSVCLRFAGHDLVPLPEGALYWPVRRALLVADLHFEKASWFAARGQLLPPYDSEETLRRLGDIADRTQARELWCLGDSFHDSAGAERLAAPARMLLGMLQSRLCWTWIVGNHDAALDAAVGGRVMPEAEIDGVLLRHAADPHDARPEVSGHFHPKLRVSVRGRAISRRCFVATERKLILPAFGAFTGGLDAADAAIGAVVGRPAAALVPVGDRLLRFPLAG